ncbi:MAG: site-specific DNA-methyltransferase [Victivallaceae bacterium]|nr:site-specific DNA-methyltransferase [Victivallaceae bacterium]
MENNRIFNEDSIVGVQKIPANSVHLILSDIPYGIGMDDWDVLHNNTNTAYLGTSPAQEKAGAIFKKRGKPLNGWSEADKQIPHQYYEWVCSWAPAWLNCLCPGGSVFVFAGRRFAHRCIVALEDSGFIFKDMLAWNKSHAPLRAQRISQVYMRRNDAINEEKWQGWRVGNLAPVFEPILWFTKPYKIGGTLADNIIQYELGAYNQFAIERYCGENSNIISMHGTKKDFGLHPTQKPEKLMEFLIELTTIKGQTVLDPFAGSGTTLVAALKLKRQYIGFEKEKSYFDIAQKRLEEEEINMKSTLLPDV